VVVGERFVSSRKKAGTAVPLHEWMLKSYLEVGHEVNWIIRTARDVAAVLGE